MFTEVVSPVRPELTNGVQHLREPRRERVLTQASVRRLEARHGEERSEYPVRALTGLWLRCSRSGHKAWYLRTRIDGADVRERIGTTETHTLAEAITAAKTFLQKVAEGVDPREEERAATVAAFEAEANTVASVVADWMRRAMSDKRSKHKIWLMFQKDVIPEIGDMPLAKVTKKDSVRVINRLVDRGAVTGSRRLFAHLSGFFNWCVGQDLLAANPMAGMARTGVEHERERFLSDEEVQFFWQATSDLGPFGLALQMILLSGSRRGEIAGLRWSEIDLKAGLIRLSGDRVKRLPKRAHEGHTIPLSTGMLNVLARCPRPASGDRFVFSLTGGERPIASYERRMRTTVLKNVAARRAAAGLGPAEPFVIHDLRRTVVTGLQRLGVPLEVGEAIVAHVGSARSGVLGVYRRYSYDAEKREALERWSRHVLSLVALPRKRLSREAAAALATEQAAADPRVPPSYRGLGSKVVMVEDGDGAGVVLGGSRPIKG